MDRLTATLADEGEARRVFYDALHLAVAAIRAGHTLTLELKPKKRSTGQNALMWSILSDLERQASWHGEKMDAESWKHLLSAGIRPQKAVPGVNGGFVVLAQKTSRMSKEELSTLIELAYSIGADQGVQWSRTSLGREVPNLE